MAASPAIAGLALHKTEFKSLPGWTLDQQQRAIFPMQRACTIIINKIRYNQWDTRTNNKLWARSCRVILKVSPHVSAAEARRILQTWYVPYQVYDGSANSGLFTGYYNPTIPGSLTETAYFSVPIYARPRDLVKIDLGLIDKRLAGHYGYRLRDSQGYQALPTRAEIAAGVPLPHTQVLAWVHDDADRFFMQIQGSGSIQLPHGAILLLGYDGQNGQTYYPIGKYLIATGAIPKTQVSMQTIRAWLNRHPDEASAVLNLDPSFVFFKKLNTEQPLGSMGIPLTPGRSLAVDDDYIALGTPLWLSTYLPKPTADSIQAGAVLQRLVVALDTGGAIKGTIRGDVFWGSGGKAQWLAGHMQSQGQYWLLLPKGIVPGSIKIPKIY